MKINLPIEQDTCKTCGMPYGNPQPELSASRSYCQRCSNLPQNIMSVLEQHSKQLASLTEKANNLLREVEQPET